MSIIKQNIDPWGGDFIRIACSQVFWTQIGGKKGADVSGSVDDPRSISGAELSEVPPGTGLSSI